MAGSKWKVRYVWITSTVDEWCGCFADLNCWLGIIHEVGIIRKIWYGCSIDFDNDAKQEIGNVWGGVSRAMWLFRWPCVLFLITFEAACDVVAPLIYANNDVQGNVCCVKRKNERNSKQRKTMIRQIGRALCSYGWNFVCFDSVSSAWMTKGCAPDSAQVWAAQKGREGDRWRRLLVFSVLVYGR